MMPRKPRSNAALFDAITVIFLILSVTVLAGVVLIINDPNIPLNPFPPPTVLPQVQLPTLTPSSTPTATPTATNTPTVTYTPTETPLPTGTPPPTETPTPTITTTPVLPGAPVQTQPPTMALPAPLDDGSGGIVPGSGTALPTPIPAVTRAPFPFTVGNILYQANDNGQGCQWLSIAGIVTDLAGKPLPGLALELNGDNFHNVQFSGSAARWGAGGFEFNLGAAPRTAEYTLRVLGPTGGPVSDVITIDTGNTCQSNVAVVELIQNHPY
jgi:hypothetical protein